MQLEGSPVKDNGSQKIGPLQGAFENMRRPFWLSQGWGGKSWHLGRRTRDAKCTLMYLPLKAMSPKRQSHVQKNGHPAYLHSSAPLGEDACEKSP